MDWDKKWEGRESRDVLALTLEVPLVTELILAALVIVHKCLSPSVAENIIGTQLLEEQPFSSTYCRSSPAQNQTPEGISPLNHTE